jgi:two-component system chemotaxis sensor kinase CheA
MRAALDAGPVAASALTEDLLELQRAVAPSGQRPAVQVGEGWCEDPELLNDFLVEAREHLSSAENHLLALEKDSGRADSVHSIFRSFHTIKGVAGFLGLPEFQQLAHEVETLLDGAREGRLAITPSITDVVLESADQLKKWMAELEKDGAQASITPAPARLFARIRSAYVADPAEALPKPEAHAASNHSREPAETSEASTLRVDIGKLDRLVDMAGELVLAQSLVRHDPALAELNDSRLAHNLSQLARRTAEVQRIAMSLRMVPVGRLFRRTKRLVRDLAQKTGKNVTVEISGGETELDRSLVEELSDPLMHMVRNGVDHGIEAPGVRAAAGKPQTGVIRLRASHEAGHIVIEVSDDGSGLNRKRLLEKAVEKGLVQPESDPADTDLLQLIFSPGFSTAERVTDVSGRGVGMDVVRRRLHKMRGRIEVQSIAGEGTCFLIRLPLTLAIIDGLVVAVGRERYIIPIFAVRETLRPTPGTVITIENSAEAMIIRERLLPIIRLGRVFGVESRAQNASDGVVIVSDVEGRSFGLLVDDVVGKQEVVMKGLGGILKDVAGVAGGAILGDGRIGLILDLPGIYRPPENG